MSIVPSEHSVRSADGTDIGFLAQGRGPAIVFVHGGLTMGDEWRGVAAELADRFTCLIMTRRGRGRSGDAADYSLDKEREDIQAVMTFAGGDATLLGHSYGAVCALEAARVGAIRRLILYEPPLPIDAPVVGPAFGDVRAAVASGRFESALTIMLRDLVRNSPEQIAALRRSPIWSDMTALTPTVVRELAVVAGLELGVERFRHLSSPTLLLLGTETAAQWTVAANATITSASSIIRWRAPRPPSRRGAAPRGSLRPGCRFRAAGHCGSRRHRSHISLTQTPRVVDGRLPGQ